MGQGEVLTWVSDVKLVAELDETMPMWRRCQGCQVQHLPSRTSHSKLCATCAVPDEGGG